MARIVIYKYIRIIPQIIYKKVINIDKEIYYLY